MRRACGLALLACACAAAAAELDSVQVARAGDTLRVALRATLDAPAQASFAVFADPARLPAINPAVERVQRLPAGRDGAPRFYTELHLCVLFYCRTLHQFQEVTSQPRPDGGALHAVLLPGGDFRSGHAEWNFAADGARTRLQFSAELEPAFWLPPLVGPWLIERMLRDEAMRTGAGIERLARASDSAGVER